MTQDRFPRAFSLLKVHEGGYVNDPQDPGGATNKGVTHRTYDAWRRRQGLPTRDVRQIEDHEVETIYREQYWNTVRGDDLPPGVAYCVFDAAVNSGPARAARWLQGAVGVAQDGIIGNQTLAAVQGAVSADVINQYCDTRLAFMKRLRHWERFKNGWSRRVSEVRSQSLKWAANFEPVPSSVPPQPKAEGPESQSAIVQEAMANPSLWSAAAGILGSVGTMATGSGPVQWALASVMVVVALAAVWWLVTHRKEVK